MSATTKTGSLCLVCRIEDFGALKVLCFNDFGQPHIYSRENDATAELVALQLAEKHPGYVFKVIDGEML